MTCNALYPVSDSWGGAAGGQKGGAGRGMWSRRHVWMGAVGEAAGERQRGNAGLAGGWRRARLGPLQAAPRRRVGGSCGRGAGASLRGACSFAWVRRLLRDGREGADSAVLSTRSDAEARELRPPPSPLHPRATPPGTPPPDGRGPVNARGARDELALASAPVVERARYAEESKVCRD